MAKGMFDVQCPCCQATLRIDSETRAIIAHTIPERPRLMRTWGRSGQAEGRRGAARRVFRKQVEAQKSHGKVLEKNSTSFSSVPRSTPTRRRPCVRSTSTSAGRSAWGRKRLGMPGAARRVRPTAEMHHHAAA